MKLEEIKKKLTEPEYDFLRNNEHLGNRIILLGLGGSYAYGTNTDTSDLDIRGCASNSAEEILLGRDFEQVTDVQTDTTVYSFRKLIGLLVSCNPNTIEILGLKPEHYLYLSDEGRQLLENRHLFLSGKAIRSFSGYADDQFRRMYNLSGRLGDQSLLEDHVLVSMEKVMTDFRGSHPDIAPDAVRLYTDTASDPELEKEVFVDAQLSHYPVRCFRDICSKLTEVVRSYEKAGKRNQNAVTHKKLGKHMMHLLRLYMMCIDILEKREIITFREKEHDLLMSIRNGKYLDENSQPVPEFFELIDSYRKRLDYAKENTDLPAEPDLQKINEFVMSVNRNAVTG